MKLSDEMNTLLRVSKLLLTLIVALVAVLIVSAFLGCNNKESVVRYTVEGTSNNVSITYTDQYGSPKKIQTSLPWSISFSCDFPVELRAKQMSPSGTLTGTIYRDAKTADSDSCSDGWCEITCKSGEK